MPNSFSVLERALFLLGISLATFMMVLDYSIANVSIPYIAGNLGSSNEQGTYVITFFSIGNAIGLAMTGWLTKRIGEARLLIFSIFLFTVLSAICGLSFSLDMLVFSRFIQGLVASPIIPLGQSLLIKYATPESRSKDLAIWSTIVIVAPVLGPILGGYISDQYSWAWIFYINIPIGIFCALALKATLKRHQETIETAPLDKKGLLFLATGVICLQFLLDKGQEWDWFHSVNIRLLAVGATIFFTFLWIQEHKHPSPLIDLELFKIPTFTLAMVCLMISYSIYFGSVVVVPLWLQMYMGYNASWAGIAISAVGIAPVLLSMLSYKVIAKIGKVFTLLLSFGAFMVASFYSAFFNTDIDIFHISLSRFIFGVGLVCYMNALVSLSVQDIPAHFLAKATSLFHFIRSMMGAVGTSIFTTIWQRRTIFHHERVGSQVTSLPSVFSSFPEEVSLEVLNKLLDKQAAMLAVNDIFYCMGVLFLALIVLLTGWKLQSLAKKRAQNLAKSL